MTIKASGSPLSFSEISTEFGLPPGKNLGAYRVSQTYGTLTNLALDNTVNGATITPAIPNSVAIGSSSIKFSNFYGKKLNIVLNCTQMEGIPSHLNAKSLYNNPDSIRGVSVSVIGGFKQKPTNTNGSKVYINTNTTIGSKKGAITNTAFRTGTWNGGTELILEMGSNTKLYGSGGDGGNSGTSDPEAGINGTSALGIDYPTAIINRGRIQAGWGGGGGGSYRARNVLINAGKKRSYNQWNISSGGGGGGGAGYPAGNGGKTSGQQGNYGTAGSNGTNGGLETQGTGGAGGAEAGAGGDGGQPRSTNATKGEDSNVAGGAAGSTGYTIIYYNNGSGSSLTNNGLIYPSDRYLYNTSPT